MPASVVPVAREPVNVSAVPHGELCVTVSVPLRARGSSGSYVLVNVTVGKNTLLVAQVGIAGSTSIGDNCTLAGQVGVAGHVSIGDKVIAASKAGIPRDLAGGSVVGGIPAVPIDVWRRQVAGVLRLPDLISEVKELKKQVKMLAERLGRSDPNKQV